VRQLNPDDFVITRKRKKYKFARFSNFENCYEATEITPDDIAKKADDREITLEVGAGTALFAVELARRHPERFYVATDVKADRLQTGAKQALERKIRNIIFIRIHTMQLAAAFKPHSISEIWLTFSDPFPKTRQAKHRLSHPNFLDLYQQVLTPDGVLRQKTDNHALFDYSLEQFVANGWHIRELTYDLHESDMPDDYKIMTTFEKRFVDEGLPIYLASSSC
jgi:tRNA (guanine-N7-)-methyltransferase